MPQFLTFTEQQGFSIRTGNPADFGTYQVELTATVDGPSTVGEVDLIYTFELKRCQLDEVSQSSAIPNMEYIIGTGPLTIPTNVANMFDECDVTFELTMNGQPYDPQIINLDENQRAIIVDSDDIALNK